MRRKDRSRLKLSAAERFALSAVKKYMDHKNCIIRPLTLADAGDILRIAGESFSDPWSENSVVSGITAEGSVCFAAGTEGVLAGYLIAQNISGELNLDSVAVAPRFRNQGVANALMTALCDYSKENNCSFIILEVRSHNIPAISLYEKFGFTRVGLRKNYYRDPADDAIIMKRICSAETN